MGGWRSLPGRMAKTGRRRRHGLRWTENDESDRGTTSTSWRSKRRQDPSSTPIDIQNDNDSFPDDEMLMSDEEETPLIRIDPELESARRRSSRRLPPVDYRRLHSPSPQPAKRHRPSPPPSTGLSLAPCTDQRHRLTPTPPTPTPTPLTPTPTPLTPTDLALDMSILCLRAQQNPNEIKNVATLKAKLSSKFNGQTYNAKSPFLHSPDKRWSEINQIAINSGIQLVNRKINFNCEMPNTKIFDYDGIAFCSQRYIWNTNDRRRCDLTRSFSCQSPPLN